MSSALRLSVAEHDQMVERGAIVGLGRPVLMFHNSPASGYRALPSYQAGETLTSQAFPDGLLNLQEMFVDG